MNCQSFENGTMEFATDRLNVIKADNNVGKSVLYKMLKLTASPKYYSASDRKQLIRRGCSAAAIIYEFDTGNFAYVKVFPTSVIYGYSKGGGPMVESTLPDPEMLAEIGLLSSDAFVANIIDTEQDLLLVNPKLSANAELMKLLVYCEDLENVRDKVENIQHEVAYVKSSLKYKEDHLNKMIQELQYVDVYKLEQRYETACTCKSLIYDTIIPIYKKSKKINVGSKKVNYEHLLELVNTLESIESLNLSKVFVKPFDEGLMDVYGLLESIERMRFLKAKEFNSDLLGLLCLMEKLESVKLQTATKFDAGLVRLLSLLDGVESLKFVSVHKYDNRLPELNSALEKIENLQLQKLAICMSTASKSMEQIEELKKELISIGVISGCPIYGKVVYDGKECVPCDN